MPKKNPDYRKCDGFCNEFFYAGEMTFAGIIPGRGECYFCPKCDAERKQAIKKKKSQLKLF